MTPIVRDLLPIFPAATTPELLRSSENSPLFELPLVLVRFDHVACCIVDANHSVV
jgi:hypothetical protein